MFFGLICDERFTHVSLFHFNYKGLGKLCWKQSAITLEHFTDMLIHAIFIRPPKQLQSSFSLASK